ncbi:MAG: bifunctional oligoribonuclease/PAP phosphatase NrnA [Christensenellaceae bacterium]|nr:bifunctional oligoribonuclease/PAP phosphatase NrnA [Christensenellaceae bacterium]
MKTIIEQLRKQNSFLLLGHVSPDGDTLGSVSALAGGLRRLGKQVICAVDGAVPDKLWFLRGEFYAYEDCPDTPVDCIVAVDCGDLTRLGRFAERFLDQGNTMVIDHHGTNTGYGKINLIRPYGATGQIILELLEAMELLPDAKMADALYAAISTDTGNFSYSNTDPAILAAASRLRGYGADIPTLMDGIYHRRSFAATRLIGQALERLTLHSTGRIATMYVLQSDYQVFGAQKEDCDELINYAREVEGVEIALFLRQIGPEKFKVSLRSKEYADVAKLAVEFSGGGHLHAAGCTVEGKLEDNIALLVEKAEQLL